MTLVKAPKVNCAKYTVGINFILLPNYHFVNLCGSGRDENKVHSDLVGYGPGDGIRGQNNWNVRLYHIRKYYFLLRLFVASLSNYHYPIRKVLKSVSMKRQHVSLSYTMIIHNYSKTFKKANCQLIVILEIFLFIFFFTHS